ncbi:HalD/BesD family halogenase [Shimia aestuarii]|uniref:2OG-Fe(II) oxygenase superfamily protein n=1 Tax=Shimia aestuarii TaxID=254406 RepID=A0A1I4PSJ3_9RHOB|nr:2OG-Fe(II) oxygenase [Shimia aestuarii]SFM30738.1 2OG-Fe(II) oxygenase superfamily protein [Shimia aestuarii]
MTLEDIVDLSAYPIGDTDFRASCKAAFDATGVLTMPGFVREAAISAIREEGLANQDKVYAKTEQHTVYLSAPDPAFDANHPRNRLVTSSKGCITDDLIPEGSALRALYSSVLFQAFLCEVLGEEALYEYADPLSSINLHFANTGQELGWHFDNSSFAITLMVQAPEKGGQFEYVENVRNADAGEMGFDAVDGILSGRRPVKELKAEAGTLVFFRGRNSIHRVAPNEGSRTRMLAVLAYNAEPGISLSEEARMTFYGRTG